MATKVDIFRITDVPRLPAAEMSAISWPRSQQDLYRLEQCFSEKLGVAPFFLMANALYNIVQQCAVFIYKPNFLNKKNYSSIQFYKPTLENIKERPFKYKDIVKLQLGTIYKNQSDLAKYLFILCRSNLSEILGEIVREDKKRDGLNRLQSLFYGSIKFKA